MLVYNPSIHELDEFSFTLPYSTFTVLAFHEGLEDFKELVDFNDFDSFCYENPNHLYECDVHIFKKIPPLSNKMFLITYQAASTFETHRGPYGFDVLDRPAMPSMSPDVVTYVPPTP